MAVWGVIRRRRRYLPEYNEGYFGWILAHEGDTWKIRKSRCSSFDQHRTDLLQVRDFAAAVSPRLAIALR
jgi:hypothetical protein